MIPGFEEFNVDLLGVLKRRLVHQLDRMQPEILTQQMAEFVPDVQGVYQLFHKGELVYIGKTDAKRGLRNRLSRHAEKILHRPTLIDGVRFKSIRVMVFNATDVETLLIKHYRHHSPGKTRRSQDRSIPWNGGGFGSNDPGRERETTNIAPDGFDMQHPIDIDIAHTWIEADGHPDMFHEGDMSVAELLQALKHALPYTLRFETLRSPEGHALPSRPHQDMVNARVRVPPAPQTVRSLMEAVVAALGPEWQATVFPSHVILYKEKWDYAHGRIIGGGPSTP
ncbi:MAG: GIY-YIG nuclease family protein [Gammaproteobacteria bacterium]